MLSKKIIELIEKKYGRKIRYPKDCEALSGEITQKTKQAISSSTIKRLMGFVSGTQEARTYTLDVLAAYLDCSCYEELLDKLNYHQPKEKQVFEEIVIKQLKKGQRVKLSLGSKETLLLCCSCEDEMEVLESKCTGLKLGDKITLEKILLNYPLYIKHVRRNNERSEECVVSKISGVTNIELSE